MTVQNTWPRRACTRLAALPGVGCGTRCGSACLELSNEIDHSRLLGSDSHDMDIALENMTGHAFALEFTEFVSRVKRLPVKSVVVVKGNPGQSKDLETADKMMRGQNPLLSLQLLDSLSLFPLVFHIPQAIKSTVSSQPSSPSLALAAASILRTFCRLDVSFLRHPPIHPLVLSGLTASTSVVTRLYMACALTPYRGITYVDKKSKEREAVEAVIREGLKVGTKNHYLDGIPALFTASELLKSPDIKGDNFRTPSERVAIDLWLMIFVVPCQLKVVVYHSKAYSSATTPCMTPTLTRTGRRRYSFP
ncbi:hypothetical protein F5148DRAFT_790561 [Russula earlei]|uniref:Uncharacterized protein n=1 Tax=Russula earlei TaxID=71964 RepID=A0ACC0ULN2_9AGAM|nr:hypothetical protein F5148DRAFT_790561 [Russula earlei]